MKVVFLSNYFNHHQRAFSQAMFDMLEKDYIFIETDKMGEFRVKLGYQLDSLPEYVIPYEYTITHFEEIKELINGADVLITGSSLEKYYEERKKSKKLIFRYSERLFKTGNEPLKYFPRLIKYHFLNRSKNIYLLSAGKFTAEDYRRLALFKRKSFKWGYFPDTKKYEDIDTLISSKTENSILWAGRFLKWKHPEVCFQIASKLKQDGYNFTIDMIGTIKRTERITEMAEKYDVKDVINYLGAMKPEMVREQMEKHQYFLLTSDQQEGWGAVLNEAMNSGCVALGSDATGSVSYLIKNGDNGFSYKSGDIDELYLKLKSVLDNKSEQQRLAKNAYKTITELWNGEVAAERLISLAKAILSKENTTLFENGPCSKA